MLVLVLVLKEIFHVPVLVLEGQVKGQRLSIL